MCIEKKFNQQGLALMGKVGIKLRAEIAPLMAAATKALTDTIEREVAKLGVGQHAFGLHEFVEGVVQSYGDRQMDLRLSQLADQMVQQSKPHAHAEPMDAKARSDMGAKLDEFLTDTVPAAIARSSVASNDMTPGSALVLTVPHRLSREQAAEIKQRIRAELDADVRILIIDGGASLAVLSGSMA